ncbi:MAG: hypothetical protein P8Z49_03010 [Acidobacteriota bacterium]
MRKQLLQLALIGALVVPLAGCVVTARPGRRVAVRAAVPAPVVYVRFAPPAPRAEVIPARVPPGQVWIRGHYRWDGRAYLWVPGSYVRAPHARARWSPGRWRHSNRGWYWTPGRWR